jgi:hypothetical protein
MAHCGYEPTAVAATMSSPRESLRAMADVLRGAFQRSAISDQPSADG